MKMQNFHMRIGLWGAVIPTLSVYVRAKGIVADEMALLSFLSPLLALVVRPAVAFLADKTRQHKIVCITSTDILLAYTVYLLRKVSRKVLGLYFNNMRR